MITTAFKHLHYLQICKPKSAMAYVLGQDTGGDWYQCQDISIQTLLAVLKYFIDIIHNILH